MTAELGTLLPNGFALESFTKQESVNHHMRDGTVNQTADTLTFTVPKTGILYAGKNYTINTRFGNFSGVLTNDDDYHNIYRGLSIETGAVLSILSKFNTVLPIKPFWGTLETYVNYMASLVSFTGRIVVIDDQYKPIGVMARGAYANVYEELVKVVTLNKMEIQQVSDTILVRPIRKLELNGDLFKDAMPQVTYSKSLDVKPYINVNWYEQEWGNLCQYPVQKTEEIENPGNVYIAPLAPSSQNTLSVNNKDIGDGSDYVEQTFDIQGSLESVNQPECSLPPAFMLNNSTVYVFTERWVNAGAIISTISNPSVLSQSPLNANKKENAIVKCTGNSTFYCCVKPYDSTQSPVQYASWVPYANNTGMNMTSQAQVNAYIASYKGPDNSVGFYTVIDKDEIPIMPEEWISKGGKLEVVLEKESTKIKVKVWGADLSVPGATTDEEKYPRQPYKIAISAGDGTEYNGLYITGTGIRYTPHTETITSSNLEIPAVQDEENTLVINNPYCTKQETALQIASEVDAYSNGVTYIFSGDIKHLSDSAIIKAHKGSFDYVTEFVLDQVARGTYNETSAFFKVKGKNTFEEITNYLMDQSTLHVADTEFGNIVGAFIRIDNRSYFRITEATITPSGISISGYAMMNLGDWDNAIQALDHNMTLGAWDAELVGINQRERQDGYTLEMWEQELLRLTV
jgi:hypothetical protein